MTVVVVIVAFDALKGGGSVYSCGSGDGNGSICNVSERMIVMVVAVVLVIVF